MIDPRSTRAYKLEKENRELKKEIERLKKREQECIDHYLVQCKYASEMEGKYISANYIINELEKELKNRIKNVPDTMAEVYEDESILNKLQELKGINEPSFEEMVNFVENVCKDIKNQSTLDEELEEERERIAKIVDDFKGVNK